MRDTFKMIGWGNGQYRNYMKIQLNDALEFGFVEIDGNLIKTKDPEPPNRRIEI